MTEISTSVPEDWSSVPFQRKAWFCVAVAILCPPVALWLLKTKTFYFRQKGKIEELSRTRKIVMAVSAVVMTFAWINVLLGGVSDPNLAKGLLPECDSKLALSTLKDVVSGSPAGKGIQIDDFQTITDRSGPTASLGDLSVPVDSRSCTAIGLTNVGKKTFWYEITWAGRQSDRKVYVEAKWQ